MSQAGVQWKRASTRGTSWANGRRLPLWVHVQPDMEHDDHLILTVDGPRRGEYVRVTVTGRDLLRLIVDAERERDRVETVRESA